MQRRKFLVGMGSLAAGGAATMGTGALTSGTASRNVSVSVADDSNSYMGLAQLNSANSQAYADTSGQEIVIDVSGNSNGGGGMNVDGHARFDDLFGIKNQGTGRLYAYIRVIGNGSKTNTYFYDSDNEKKALSGDTGNPGAYTDQGENDNLGPAPTSIEYSARKLTPGELLRVGLDIEEVNQNAFQQTETIQVVGVNNAGETSNFPPNNHD